MLITTTHFKTPMKVIAVVAPRLDPWPPISPEVQFDFFNGDFIEGVREGECQVIDPAFNNFVLMDKSFDGRWVIFMWKPLSDSGQWGPIREFNPKALRLMKDLIESYT